MVVGISEIEADSAAIPLNATFDLDAELGKAGLPGGQVVAVDRERHVGGAGSIVAGEDSTGDRERMERLTPLEEEEHRGGSGIKRREALRGDHGLGAEEALKERRGDVQPIAVERGFQDPPNPRHPRTRQPRA